MKYQNVTFCIGGEGLYSTYGAQEVQVFPEKHIIKSSAKGETNVAEVRWLTELILESASSWKETGWGYVVGINDMEPVNHEVSKELVELHKKVETAGCKAIAFIDPNALILSLQAKNHQRKSKTSNKEKHFKTEEEAFAWVEKILHKKTKIKTNEI